MEAPIRCVRSFSTAPVHRTSQVGCSVLPLRVLHASAQPQSAGTWLLRTERRQQLRPLCVVSRSDPSSAQTTTARPRRSGTGKDASAPLPMSEDDIMLVPCANLHIDLLEKNDVYTLSDFRRRYEDDKPNFRRFLQERVEVRDEKHLTAMESFFRALDAAAAGAAGAAAAAGAGGADRTAAAASDPEAAAAGLASSAAAAVPAPVGMTCEQVTLSVEGNISAGKSTFLSILNRHLLTDKGFSFVKEPIEAWQQVGGQPGVNLLDMFYREPTRMAYTFQNFVFLTRVLQERESYGRSSKARLLERSIFSDRMVFVRAVHASRDLADHELAIYDAWFGPILASLPTLVPNGLIYLRASPQTCMSRLRRRARSEEGGIPLAYLSTLHANHEDWLLTATLPAVALQQRAREVLEREREETARQQQQQLGDDDCMALEAQAGPGAAVEVEVGGSVFSCCSGEVSISSSVPAASSSFDSSSSHSQPQPQSQSQSPHPYHDPLPHHAAAAAAALSSCLRPLEEAPPPALALVDIPPSLEGCLHIIDATKISSVPSAGFLHQLPSLVLDCEQDVDVEGDAGYGERVSGLIRDYASFVAAYRSACHRLAARAHPHPHNASARLPRPAADYYTTDPGMGRVAYRPAPANVPGSAQAGAGAAQAVI